MAIVLVIIGGTLLIALLGAAFQGRTASRLGTQAPRRDPIADGSVDQESLARGRARENRRRKARGRRSLDKSTHDALVVADKRTRWRLRLFGGRR